MAFCYMARRDEIVWKRGKPRSGVRKVSFGVGPHRWRSTPAPADRAGCVKPRGSSFGKSTAREARRAPSTFDPLNLCLTPEKGLGGAEIAPVGTFPPSLPSHVGRRAIRMAFLESQLDGWAWWCAGWLSATVELGANPTKACRRSRLIMGMPGGRMALAIRGGRRPRAGGAKPQEAALFFSRCVKPR